MTVVVGAVIAAARNMLGLTEVPDGSNHVPYVTTWYGFDGPWCAMSVSRAFFDAGFVDAINFTTRKGFAYCPSGIAGFRARDQWHSGTVGIRPGDVLFFDWEGDGVADHVGIVEYVDASGIHTLEGNSDNRYERRLRNANIVGYGRPAYASPAPPVPKPTPSSITEDDMQTVTPQEHYKPFVVAPHSGKTILRVAADLETIARAAWGGDGQPHVADHVGLKESHHDFDITGATWGSVVCEGNSAVAFTVIYQ